MKYILMNFNNFGLALAGCLAIIKSVDIILVKVTEKAPNTTQKDYTEHESAKYDQSVDQSVKELTQEQVEIGSVHKKIESVKCILKHDNNKSEVSYKDSLKDVMDNTKEYFTNADVELNGFIKKNLARTGPEGREFENKVEGFISKGELAGDWYTEYCNFLSTMSAEQILAFGHIAAIFAIFSCLISLVSVFAGDSLIKYYKLEDNYPRVARYIQLRRKFQQYCFYFNVCLIITILLFLLYANLMLFIYR